MDIPAYETILVEQRERSVGITLNRPERLNAINDQMIDDLNDVFRRIEEAADVWTIVLTGAGRALSSGGDVNKASLKGDPEFQMGVDTRGESMLANYKQWDAPQEGTPPWLDMSKPIVCAVNGIAAGAGLDFVTTADVVIAAESASFFDPHVSIGVVSGREALRLARVLPLPVVLRMAVMGVHERLGAQRAFELGLVTEVVPDEQLVDRAWELAEIINRNAPLAVRGTRLSIRKTLALPIYEAELVSENYRMKVAVTDDASEGPRAFLEKRKPEWTAT